MEEKTTNIKLEPQPISEVEIDSNHLATIMYKNNLAITDAEYMQAEDAMRLLSSNFNKGMQQIDDMKENLEKTNKILNETFKKN